MANIMKKQNGQVPARLGGVVDQLFHNNLSRFFDDSFWGANAVAEPARVPVNIRQTENDYEISIVAPGLRKEDFKINVSGQTLTVLFEQQEQEENQTNLWITQEYQRRSFTKSFTVDDTVDINGIAARYQDGILKISLPKTEKGKSYSKEITVQ